MKDELEQRLEEVERERDEYLNDLKRLAADFEVVDEEAKS